LRSAPAGLKLTTAKFYSPRSRPYSEQGVEPDVAVRVAAKPAGDGPARPENDLLHLQLSRAQLGLAMGLQQSAATIDIDRPLQFGLARFELGDDLLELGEGLLERQFVDVRLFGHGRLRRS